jgi:MFS family permease
MPPIPSGGIEAALRDSKVDSADESGLARAVVSHPDEQLLEMDSPIAWRVLVGQCLCTFTSLGFFYTFGVFVVPYTEHYNIGRGQVSLMYTINFLFWHGLGPYGGRSGDYFGVKKTVSIGAVLFSGSLFLASLSVTYSDFWAVVLTQGFMLALGGMMTSFPVLSLTPQWFSKHRGLASGIAVTGSGLGNFVYPTVTTRLLNAYGIAKTLWILALMQLCLFSICVLLLRRRLPTVPKFGQPVDPTLLFGPKHSKPFRLIFLAAIFYASSAFVPLVHFGAFVEDQGHSESVASMAIALFGAGSAIGRPTIGLISDKLGVIRTFKLSLLSTAIVSAFWPLCKTEGAVYTFAFCYGCLAFCWYSLLPSTVALYFDLKVLGGVIGNVFIAFVPAAFSPVVAGHFFDRMGNYSVAQAYVPTLLFLTSLCIGSLPNPEPSKSPRA